MKKLLMDRNYRISVRLCVGLTLVFYIIFVVLAVLDEDPGLGTRDRLVRLLMGTPAILTFGGLLSVVVAQAISILASIGSGQSTEPPHDDKKPDRAGHAWRSGLLSVVLGGTIGGVINARCWNYQLSFGRTLIVITFCVALTFMVIRLWVRVFRKSL